MRRAFPQLIQQHRDHQRAMAAWELARQQVPTTASHLSSGLTICSVAFRAKTCLELGERLMRCLNSGSPRPQWLVFDNNIERSETLDPSDQRFTVVKAERREFALGYDHALGIATLLSKVRTRFLLIQDPDCFIVRPDWIRRVPQYMLDRQLGFFGTPINPRRHNSYRYFPYMVCMFVDLARVPASDLCFVPEVWRFPTSLQYRARHAFARIPKLGILFRWLLTEQWKTNGYRIKEQYGRGDRVKFECVQPVWDVDDTVPPGSLKRVIHELTPASVSPVPKQPGYCSKEGFRDFGAPDVQALGWEEFAWQGRPFAFHVGSAHGQPGRYERQLERVLQQFQDVTAERTA